MLTQGVSETFRPLVHHLFSKADSASSQLSWHSFPAVWLAARHIIKVWLPHVEVETSDPLDSRL